MAAGLGAESLAAKFKQGGALGTYRDKWLLLSAADVEAEDRLAKKFGIPLIRAILGSEALNMADILGSWFRNCLSKVDMALSGKGAGEDGAFRRHDPVHRLWDEAGEARGGGVRHEAPPLRRRLLLLHEQLEWCALLTHISTPPPTAGV